MAARQPGLDRLLDSGFRSARMGAAPVRPRDRDHGEPDDVDSDRGGGPAVSGDSPLRGKDPDQTHAPGATVAASESAEAVAVEDVTFTYHRGESPALAGASFRQAPGEMVGVMGASGAGKSTLAKCLNRIIPAFEDGEFRGVVRIGGRSLEGARVCDVAPLVGMVFQDFEAQLFSTNVAHEVAFAMEQVGIPRGE